MKHHEMIKAVIEGAECRRPLGTVGWVHVTFFFGALRERTVDPGNTGLWNPLSAWVYDTWEIAPPAFVSFVEAFAAMKLGKRVRFDGWPAGITLEFSNNRFHRKLDEKEGAVWQPSPNELDECRWIVLA